MDPLKTILGTDIPIETRGIVYLCHYDYDKKTLTVCREIFFNSAFDALNLYSNIPNPESQIASGKDFNSFILELSQLHSRMQDPKWVKELSDYL